MYFTSDHPQFVIRRMWAIDFLRTETKDIFGRRCMCAYAMRNERKKEWIDANYRKKESHIIIVAMKTIFQGKTDASPNRCRFKSLSFERIAAKRACSWSRVHAESNLVCTFALSNSLTVSNQIRVTLIRHLSIKLTHGMNWIDSLPFDYGPMNSHCPNQINKKMIRHSHGVSTGAHTFQN